MKVWPPLLHLAQVYGAAVSVSRGSMTCLHAGHVTPPTHVPSSDTSQHRAQPHVKCHRSRIVLLLLQCDN